VYVFSPAGAGADDGVVPGETAPPAPPVAEEDGLGEADGVAEAAGEDAEAADAVAEAAGEDDEAAGAVAEGVAETMAPQPASEKAAAARAVITGARNAGRMMVPFEMTPSSSQGLLCPPHGSVHDPVKRLAKTGGVTTVARQNSPTLESI
jgi:hypothetical protein